MSSRLRDDASREALMAGRAFDADPRELASPSEAQMELVA